MIERQATTADQYELKYAGFWVRFWAFVLDMLTVNAIGAILVKPLFKWFGWSLSKGWFLFFTPYRITLFIIAFLYFAIMTKKLGQTLGKMIVGIQVKSAFDAPLTWKQVFFREVIGRFISRLLVLPYLSIPFLPKKEAVHDLIADTVVVYEDTYALKHQPIFREPTIPTKIIEQSEVQ